VGMHVDGWGGWAAGRLAGWLPWLACHLPPSCAHHPSSSTPPTTPVSTTGASRKTARATRRNVPQGVRATSQQRVGYSLVGPSLLSGLCLCLHVTTLSSGLCRL